MNERDENFDELDKMNNETILDELDKMTKEDADKLDKMTEEIAEGNDDLDKWQSWGLPPAANHWVNGGNPCHNRRYGQRKKGFSIQAETNFYSLLQKFHITAYLFLIFQRSPSTLKKLKQFYPWPETKFRGKWAKVLCFRLMTTLSFCWK